MSSKRELKTYGELLIAYYKRYSSSEFAFLTNFNASYNKASIY